MKIRDFFVLKKLVGLKGDKICEIECQLNG